MHFISFSHNKPLMSTRFKQYQSLVYCMRSHYSFEPCRTKPLMSCSEQLNSHLTSISAQLELLH